MTLKLFHAHYRLVDPAFGVARILDEGDTRILVDTDDEGDFEAAIAAERSKIAKQNELIKSDGVKIVFTAMSLLHSEETPTLPPVQTVKTFEGDRVIATVKSNKKFL